MRLAVAAPPAMRTAAARLDSRPRPGASPAGLLALQRQAGNRAVAGMVAKAKRVQRLTADEKAQGLSSEKYAGQPRLEKAFDNSPALGIGESGEGVRLVQEGLVAEGHELPKSTKPNGDMDGQFGGETFAAVKQFQADKEIPGGPDGRIGRNTMGKLDELAAKGGGGGDDVKPDDVCGGPACGPSLVQVKPNTFVSLCKTKLRLGKPLVDTVGCPPRGVGNVGFFAGAPGWQLDGPVQVCTTPKGTPIDTKIQVGYIQTVEGAVHAADYRNPKTGALTRSDCKFVLNARDCIQDKVMPWYDAPGTNFGPVPLGNSPALSDTPHLAPLKSSVPGKGTLQQIFLLGTFHIWLVARLPNGRLVFIHHWDVGLFARAMLKEDGHPCSRSAWQVDGGPFEAGNGPGKGSATPVETGNCAKTLSKSC